MPTDPVLFFETWANARQSLLAERNPRGHWTGELSNSALSTATAVFALSLARHSSIVVGTRDVPRLIEAGLCWLAEHQNDDGGWGDTVRSFSNISTTALGWAALAVPEAGKCSEAAAKAEAWLIRAAGSLRGESLARAIVARYGNDRTFSVPILTMLTLAGRLGPEGWRWVPPLPFELAALPFGWFQWLQLPVVSYALPALIALGQVRHHFRPSFCPLLRGIRQQLISRTLRILRDIQPSSGGYLEATPLTSFVVMSLIACGRGGDPVVTAGLRFLEESARADGSWAIDTNLATWVTTLAVNALDDNALSSSERGAIRDWLLQQQYHNEHPYTHAAPGGWAWTDCPGGVPDADDTPGALLALAKLGDDVDCLCAARAGIGWLLDLQNRDGGIPTFCRGWTGLPFDRSSADLTAHTLRAWSAWFPRVDAALQRRIIAGTRRALRYLVRTQRADGAWAPLWFGSQYVPEPDVANLTYGTSRVVRLAGVGLPANVPGWESAKKRGQNWLLNAQQPSGGWSGGLLPTAPPSIEETALAVEALACCPRDRASDEALARGLYWLAEATDRGRTFAAAPIGFYFANLWYYERLYPRIFTVAALQAIARGTGTA